MARDRHYTKLSLSSALLLYFSGMFVCCVDIPFVLDVRLVDVPAGVTQEEGHTGFLRLTSAVLALFFLARRIQPFLSLVDRELIVLHLLGIIIYFIVFYYFFVRIISLRVTAPRFGPTSQRPKVSRLPTEPPGRPAIVLLFVSFCRFVCFFCVFVLLPCSR